MTEEVAWPAHRWTSQADNYSFEACWGFGGKRAEKWQQKVCIFLLGTIFSHPTVRNYKTIGQIKTHGWLLMLLLLEGKSKTFCLQLPFLSDCPIVIGFSFDIIGSTKVLALLHFQPTFDWFCQIQSFVSNWLLIPH